MLANYVCSKLGMKTAYVELNTTNQIHSICQKKEKPSFTYKGIVFYPNTSVTSLSELLHKDYQYFILDMGVLNTYTMHEFLHCNKSFLVCSPSKWRRSQSTENFKKLFENFHYQHCKVIMNLCEKESDFSPISNACEHIPFPYFQNPFRLEAKCLHAIYQILKT